MDQAVAEARQAQELDPLSVTQAKDVAEAVRRDSQRAGYRFATRRLYQRKLDEFRQPAQQDYVTPYLLADLYVLMGDRDEALAWLEKAYAERSSKLVDLKSDPDFDGIRGDPRFANLVRRIGLP